MTKSTLELAIRARLPMVSVATDDPVDVDIDLRELTAGRPVHEQTATGIPAAEHVYFTSDPRVATEKSLDRFKHVGTTLVLVNMHSELALDCGVVPVNIDRLVHSIATSDPLLKPEDVAGFLPLVRGLTVRQAHTCCALAVAQNLKLTAEGIRDVRLHLYGKQVGLEYVSTSDMGPYSVPEDLKAWLEVNGPYLGHRQLSPRGVLFSGLPGTGKTMGAKYIARRLGLPLQRLDLSAVLSKWVGESEVRLRELLANVDREAPCVLLIDETEKLFKPANDSSVTDRLLSHLLWWLQEHESTVLTVLTTNDHASMPPELFRPGRIDRTFTLLPVSVEEAKAFCLTYARDVFGVVIPKKTELQLPGALTYAALVAWVHATIKKNKLVPATTTLKESI